MSQPLVLGAVAKGTDWAAVTAWAAWATVGIYVVIGLFAWRQVREARKLREEQARPFVIVDFEPNFLVYLTVENLGRTMARVRGGVRGGPSGPGDLKSSNGPASVTGRPAGRSTRNSPARTARSSSSYFCTGIPPM
jgi:hypothetical protein